MKKAKYLILGAGPAGLTVANKLLQKGETSFLVLEKQNTAGGLCRSEDVDGAPLDIGGGHFLDVRRPKVLEFIFQFMPEDEWNMFDRNSQIVVKENIINHPIEANIWQMNISDQVEYLKSIAKAGCNSDEPIPTKFVDWIYWKLGSKIAEDYMIPYNQKMFSNELNQLGTYWLEKLPSVSFEETLISCLKKKAYGTQPGHAQFYYPKKYGYGELWLRMAETLGDKIKYNTNINSINFETKTINDEYQADVIINTIPWSEFKVMTGMPKELRDGIGKLKHSSIQVEYYDENIDTSCQWRYYPELKLAYHRILVRHNFCTDSKGYWTETNSERVEPSNRWSYTNKYAYPLNTIGKPEVIEKLLSWTKSKGVYGLGRWGTWQHLNSDVTVESAMSMAEILESESHFSNRFVGKPK